MAYHGNKYYAEAIHPDFALGRVFTEKYEAGHLGKKTGQGIFDWSNGRPAIDLEAVSQREDRGRLLCFTWQLRNILPQPAGRDLMDQMNREAKSVAIINHPDVRRNLLWMKFLVLQ